MRWHGPGDGRSGCQQVGFVGRLVLADPGAILQLPSGTGIESLVGALPAIDWLDEAFYGVQIRNFHEGIKR